MNSDIDSLLQPFQSFGIHLGLKRIENLLAALDNPHHHVPIIHVAGTNGKGSVCAYLSSILTEAGYQVGRYTSPHLISWQERICLNEKPIDSQKLTDILLHIKQVIDPDQDYPTLFEVITAAAWLYFAQCNVDLAIMEVGLGGRLDATNVCDRPLISVITSISKDHWQRLGSTLTEISTEKAGILKPGCPAVIGKLPLEAEIVIRNRVKQLNCDTVWVEGATEVKQNGQPEKWACYQGIKYPLKLLGSIQLVNSAIAIACLKILQDKGWQISENAIREGMRKTNWPGRIEWIRWKNHDILIDGAHNSASARVLRQYVDTIEKPITWVMGMLSTKDHQEILKVLLRENDHLFLVSVPNHSTAEPKQLAKLAVNLFPNLKQVNTYAHIFAALDEAICNNHNNQRLIVICGSLYLLGHFLAQNFHNN